MSVRKERLWSSRTVARMVNGIRGVGNEVLSRGSRLSTPRLEQDRRSPRYSPEAAKESSITAPGWHLRYRPWATLQGES